MGASSRIVPPKRFWLRWQEEFLRQHYADALTVHLAQVLGTSVKRVLAKANAMGLRKSVELIAATAAERTRLPGHGGQAHQFKKGLVPWNKGTHFKAGGRSAETRFKPGARPHTWVPVGTFRVTPDGCLEKKFSDDAGPPRARWRNYALMVWEAEHGPVEKGCVVVFKPGMKTTDPALVTLDRLECINRQQLMQRNSYHTNLPPELARVVQLRGVLSRAINQRAKKEAAA